MLYNLLSVGEAQMFIFDGVLDKTQFNIMSVPLNMSVHFLTGREIHLPLCIIHHTKN